MYILIGMVIGAFIAIPVIERVESYIKKMRK